MFKTIQVLKLFYYLTAGVSSLVQGWQQQLVSKENHIEGQGYANPEGRIGDNQYSNRGQGSSREVETLRSELKRLHEDNSRLHENLVSALNPCLPGAEEAGEQTNDLPSDESRLKTAFIRSQRDLVCITFKMFLKYQFIN